MKPLTKNQRANARRWVANLRGEGPRTYGQARLRLSTHDRTAMCCLGVLCDTVDPDGWTDASAGCAHRGYTIAPGLEIYKTVGLDRQFAGRLAEANDNGKSFAEIADLITETLGL
jgi:hypothetical protein